MVRAWWAVADPVWDAWDRYKATRFYRWCADKWNIITMWGV